MFCHAKRWRSAVGVSALRLVRWMEREYHHIEASKPADSDTGSKAKEVMDEASLPVYALAEVRVYTNPKPYHTPKPYPVGPLHLMLRLATRISCRNVGGCGRCK